MLNVGAEASRRFWNEKAKEDPYWYVSSYGEYGSQRNLDEFWASGKNIWQQLKSSTGYRPEAGHRVVEIGCGVGRLTRVIAPEVGRVHAFDISEGMLAIAEKAGLPNVSYHLARDFGLEPVPDGCAHLALGYCVFQHLPSMDGLRRYLAEMVRVTVPGGIVAFTLTPKDWRSHLLPLLRLRSYIRARLAAGGPTGLHRKEWVGIRPSRSAVERICPVSLERAPLFGDKWLFVGRRPGPTAAPAGGSQDSA